MKIYLADTDKRVVDAWNRKMGMDGYYGDLFNVETDAIVSPANSFGFMDGNVDRVISEKLGWHVQKRLQTAIQFIYNGELLVGQAHVLYTEHPTWKYVISAPTMRVPTKIVDPTAIYLAARAAVRAGKRTKAIQSMLFTGMGTGCGQMNPEAAVALMVRGIADALKEPAFPASWRDAQADHDELVRIAKKPHVWTTRTIGNSMYGASIGVCSRCGAQATMETNNTFCEAV
ncbi:Appr-1-p processing enzyme family protein [Rhizobium phage RHph_TM16]|nr:Appr-1-p processing enzyme family protein [Rhizobium phage RHph_TM16]